jgi:hypothetical protein
MKKWMLVSTCALCALVLGALTAWGSDEEEAVGDEDTTDYEAMVAEIEAECEASGCVEDGPITDEAIDEMGFDSLLIDDAWGCCAVEEDDDHNLICHCVEPSPGGGTPPTWTEIAVGRAYGVVLYDTLAVSGTYNGSSWSYSACGGCRKAIAGIDRLLVDGHSNTGVSRDYVRFVNTDSYKGSNHFAAWWSSAYWWDLVTGRGLDGVDHMYGARQTNCVLWGGTGDDIMYGDAYGDVLYGDGGDDKLYGSDGNDYLFGVAGNDHLYGEAGDDYLSGGDGDDVLYGGNNSDTLIGGYHSSGDYCNCGADGDPADSQCETAIYCDDL